jgi:hypothetical protein
MPGRARSIAVAASVLALSLALGVAAPAGADLREFVGSVQEVSGGGVVVRSRAGDQRRFVRTPRTRVAGARSRWEDLRGGDSVIVTWDLDDDPVECRRIDVLSTSNDR